MADKTYLKTTLAISLVLILLAFSTTAHAKTIYVDDDAPGANDGSSWPDAFNYLQDALADAASSDEIHVAQGVYKPDQGTGITPGDRTVAFQLINSITLKGGYAGFGESKPNVRDIQKYETVLSGDLVGNDEPNFLNNGENSYHVVTAVETDETAVLDGFIITAGNANGQDWPVYQNRGGGMYTDSGSPTVTRCTFSKNSAAGYGGGMYNLFSNPTVTNCTFNANTSTKAGGGMCNIDSSSTLSHCAFMRNFADIGGGIYNNYNHDDDCELINCTFSGNSAEWRGGGICGGRGLINKCTIIGNTAYSGGGLAYYDGQITNCIISGNSAQYNGGGMHNDCTTPTVSNCIISDNTAGNWGGGICNYGDTDPSKSTLISCTVSGNSAKYGGGILNTYNGHATLRSCLVTGNRAELGAAICNGWWTSATLTNCTLSGNYAEDSGGAIYNKAGERWDEVTLTNCVLWADTPEEIYLDERTLVVTYSDVQSGWPGVGNIDVDPCFMQPGYWDANGAWLEGDYRLMLDSPCINAAEPNYVTGPNETDLDGNRRVMGGRIDMGAYESTRQAPVFVVSADSVVVPEGGTAKFKVALESDPLCTVEVTVSHCSGDADITVASGETLTFDSSNYSKPQTVTLAAAEDVDPHEGMALIWVDAPGFVLTVVIVMEGDNDAIVSTVYVDTDAGGANNGTSWRDAFTDLQDALTYARMVPGVAEIRVAEGIYKPDQGSGVEPGDCEATFSLINGIAITGGYAGLGERNADGRDIERYGTILSGDLRGDDDQTLEPEDLRRAPCRTDNSHHVVTASGTDFTTVLDGFTISGGNGVYGSGMFNSYGNLTVSNCIFTMNSASADGGALCSTGRPRISNCIFIRNAASDDAGGIYNSVSGRATITNCTFSNNWAQSRGGGMYNRQGYPKVIACTFCDNSAGRGGAIGNVYGETYLANCIFRRNSARYYGGAIYNQRSSPLLKGCTLAGNLAQLGGGIYNRPETTPSRRCTPTVLNCILWGNADIGSMGHGTQIYAGAPIVSYSCIQGSWPGEGNIDADPFFVESGYWDANGTQADYDDFWVEGDYHLLPVSPCIDAGDPDYIPEPNETDLDGKPRVINGRIDMGAYEYNPTILAEARILPRTINLTSKGNWITCYIWLPDEHDVVDIEPNSVLLEDEIQPDQFSVDKQTQLATARFNRKEVQAILDVGRIELTIIGRLTDGTVFEGTDKIKVTDRTGGKSAK
jgi:parallel beta-helix repeat protein/predicted outer membrane repeat protein